MIVYKDKNIGINVPYRSWVQLDKINAENAHGQRAQQEKEEEYASSDGHGHKVEQDRCCSGAG